MSGFTHDATTGLLTRIAVNPDGGMDLPVGMDPVFIAADPKGRCLYVARQSGPALDTLGSVTDTEPASGQCLAMSFAPDGKTLFCHTSPGTMVPIDPATGAMNGHTAKPFGQARSAAWVVR